MASEADIRRDIVAACREMNASGLNQGTSGNISVRHDGRILITPSAVPYDALTPDMIVALDPDDATGGETGALRPSSEWRFHRRLLNERNDLTAIVHVHPTYCTALAILRRPIPACHYMIAAFGGNDVRCAGYATFGTEDLSDLVVEAMRDRTACLMANHGAIAAGEGLAMAMWRAVELETLARQYVTALRIGDPVILSDAQIADAARRFAGYGLREDRKRTP